MAKDDEVLLDNDDLDVNSPNEEENNDYPLEELNIKNSFYTIYELKRKYEKNLIKLDAEFQRNEVWKLKQKIELIESILMGLPLPNFYFNQDKEGTLIVVDGRQRLSAIFSYMNDDFKLSGLKILPDKYEKKFSELLPLYQSKIEDYQIQANVIMPPTPDRVKFDIFDRVNRTGTPLNKQEIRNALYQGASTELLKEIEQSEIFLKATENGLVKDKRMKASYLILRFISFYLLKAKVLKNDENLEYEYKSINELLATTMEYINKLPEEDIIKIKEIINNALNNCITYDIKDAFRLNRDGKTSPINMNVFETVCYILSKIPSTLDKQKVNEAIKALKVNPDFLENIGNHRDSEYKVKARFAMADNIIKELIK